MLWLYGVDCVPGCVCGVEVVIRGNLLFVMLGLRVDWLDVMVFRYCCIWRLICVL